MTVLSEATEWVVYLILCHKNQSYYCGISTDVLTRLKKHNAGTGARYTRSHGPCTLVYVESAAGRSAALRRERAIKSLNHEQKRLLAASWSPY